MIGQLAGKKSMEYPMSRLLAGERRQKKQENTNSGTACKQDKKTKQKYPFPVRGLLAATGADDETRGA
jgi:hypothetical protein